MKLKSTNHRLSKLVLPERYEISMRPDLETHTFIGEETIYMSVQKATPVLTLHSLHLQITEAHWTLGKQKIVPTKITYDIKNESASLHFAKKLTGKGKLSLNFQGVLNTALHGFYKSHYQHNNKTHTIATTQFEATDARRAFPCFDEPSHKAIFDVTMIVPERLTAISNTIESSIATHSPGYKVVKFAATPKMSTYLLAFIVGDFENAQTKTKDGTIVRVFTTPGKSRHAQFALIVAKRGLEFFNNYFAITYPLPVLDLIAIPDFSAGAMENWGAITFRETTLLVDEKFTPFVNRERVAEVILHELVHQWFGNLVTMEWWTYLWLNESFATYMASVALDQLFPQWHIWTKFVLSDQTRGLLLDSLPSTHPIEVEVEHPNQISQIFDDISYRKGASVLRMLTNYIGENNFRDGLRLYLKKHSYKNTASVHLWEAFEKVSGKPVRQFMHVWISKPGYPFLKASLRNSTLYLQQSQFSLDSNLKSRTVWHIPIQAQTSNNKVTEVYELKGKQGKIIAPANAKFLKLNHDEQGFYYTSYDLDLLAKLFIALENKQLSAINQLGLIRNQFQLCKAGLVGVDAFLEMLLHIRDYNSYVTWAEIASDLNEIDNTLIDEQTKKQFYQFAAKLFAPIVKELGWQPKAKETNNLGLLRAVALLNAAHYGDKAVITIAKTLFHGSAKGQKLNPDLKMVVLAITAHNGTERDYNLMRKQYSQAQMQEERDRLARALLMFEKKTLLTKTLRFVFSGAVRTQDLPLLIFSGMGNPSARELVWAQTAERWNSLLNRFQDKHLLGWFAKGTAFFSTKKDYQQIKTFFRTHEHPGAQSAVNRALENIAINISWVKNDRKTLERYLRGQVR